MTAEDASSSLFDWFAEHDSFELDEDFKKIILVTDHPKRDKAAFLTALAGFTETGLVKLAEVGDVKYWILSKAFASYEQNVTISSALSVRVSGVINSFREAFKIAAEHSDPSNLSERDIDNLVFVCDKLLERKDSEDSS